MVPFKINLNEKVVVMSTGMGGPSTAIGVEELYKKGIKRDKMGKKVLDKGEMMWYISRALAREQRTLKIKQRRNKQGKEYPWRLIWEVLSSTTVILVNNKKRRCQ